MASQGFPETNSEEEIITNRDKRDYRYKPGQLNNKPITTMIVLFNKNAPFADIPA